MGVQFWFKPTRCLLVFHGVYSLYPFLHQQIVKCVHLLNIADSIEKETISIDTYLTMGFHIFEDV